MDYSKLRTENFDEQRFEGLAKRLQDGTMSRRQFFRWAAVTGASLSVTMSVLATACGTDTTTTTTAGVTTTTAAATGSTTATSVAGEWNPYPFDWGTEAIATTPDEAIKWWVDRFADSAAPDQDPSVVLTADELAQLKSMAPKVGHAWYGLFVPAIEGWNRFWKDSASTWASETLVYDVEGKPEKDILGAQFLIDAGLKVAGNLSVDWILFSEAMKRYHEAGVATTSVVGPASAYYPTTTSCMPDQVKAGATLVKTAAERLAKEGFTEVDAIHFTLRSPSYFSVARDMGFLQGLQDPEMQKICKINIVDTIPVAENEDAQAAATGALRQYPNVHLMILMSHQYIGASAAIRDAGRKDCWVVAFDLDEGTATDLLSGGWPVCTTYSLPIAQSGIADANAMGKILLGKKVPLIIESVGTPTTPENVAEAYAHDWGGEALPWSA